MAGGRELGRRLQRLTAPRDEDPSCSVLLTVWRAGGLNGERWARAQGQVGWLDWGGAPQRPPQIGRTA
jgi:hypothetical protein